jgi:hypothetical protein
MNTIEHVLSVDDKLFRRETGAWGKRIYVDEAGREYANITGILKVIPNPALSNWKAKNEKNACWKAAWKVSQNSHVETEEQFFQHCESEFKKENIEQEGQNAATIGFMIHETIEQEIQIMMSRQLELLIQTPSLLSEIDIALDHFREFVKTFKLDFICAERVVYSERQPRFAGTIDAIANINGIATLIDWKTSKAIYPEYWIQLAAYHKAFFRTTMVELPQVAVVLIPKVSSKVPEIQILKAHSLERYYRTFEAAFELYLWQNSDFSSLAPHST